MAVPSPDPLYEKLLRAASDVARAVERLRGIGRRDENLERLLPYLRPGMLLVADLGSAAAFKLDEKGRMIFNSEGLYRCVELARTLHAKGLAPFNAHARTERMCFMLYLLHEIAHRPQSLAHYDQVQALKAGLDDFGLALMDVAADGFAITNGAMVDSLIEEGYRQDSILHSLSAACRVAVAFGAFVFKPEGRAAKVQRFLGAALGKVLVDEHRFSRLRTEKINPLWTPGAPIILFDPARVPQLNGLLLQPTHAVLFDYGGLPDRQKFSKLWLGIDQGELDETFRRIREMLLEMGVLRA